MTDKMKIDLSTMVEVCADGGMLKANFADALRK